MILQNPDAVSKKIAKMGFCPRFSFMWCVIEFRGHTFYCRSTYIVWQSFKKIGAQAVQEAYLEKLKRKIYLSSSVTQRASDHRKQYSTTRDITTT